MEEEALSKYKRAGQIAAKAKEYSKSLLKKGTLLLEIADKVEAKIKELGGKPAFPVNLSINETAAHHVPAAREKLALRAGDLVKVDLGVHIDGWIADTAFSVSIGNKDGPLIKAASSALAAALKLARPGIKVCEVGEAIAAEINKARFQPIRNLTGHLVDHFNLHAGLNIPNYDNSDSTQLLEGMVLAIEPFATPGEGLVLEGKVAEVFKLEKEGIIRAKDVLTFIKENFSTLPFAKRWLVTKFGLLKTNLALREGLVKGLLKEYKVLREKTNAKIAQAEHTVIVSDKPIIITL